MVRRRGVLKIVFPQHASVFGLPEELGNGILPGGLARSP